MIAPPTHKILDELHRLARQFGIETFLSVGREYLSLGDWFDRSGEFITRLAKGHEWERFSENFSLYHGDLRNRLAREAREAEEQRLAAEQLAKESAKQRALESDPEYQRQREEERLAAIKYNAEQRRNNHVDRMVKNFCKTAQSITLEDDNSPQTRVYYQIRDLLWTMRSCSDDDLKVHVKTYSRLMDVLENPPDDPEQGADTEEVEL